ncbi:MAG: response regulator [Pseudomonadota bacterium]
MLISVNDMPRPRLLIIDDEEMFCAFVAEVAEEMGYEVRVLTTSGEFIATFNAFQPQAVFLDMVMPELDGTEITRLLAERKFCGKLFIVTGYNQQYSKIAKALGELGGLSDVERLSKPLRLEELRRVLRI